MKLKIFTAIMICLCFSPLLSKIDNYEDLLENNYYKSSGIYSQQTGEKAGDLAHFKIVDKKSCQDQFDGSSIQAQFIPFGTLITACSDDYYFHLFGIIKIHFQK